MRSSKFQRALLAGTAIVAVSAVMMDARVTYAAGEFAVDTNNSNNDVYETDIDTGTAWNAHDAHDLRVDDSGTLLIDDTDTFGDGNAAQAAIVPSATGKTLTLSDQSNNNGNAEVAVEGNIDVGDFAALNLAVHGDGVDAAGDGLDELLLDVNGSINLGTGTLLIKADQDTGGSDVTVKVSGNVTASTITLDSTAASSVSYLVLDGSAEQTVTGTIDGAANGEGVIEVRNTGGSVIFASDIGATKTLELVYANQDGTNLTTTFRGDVKATGGISFGDNSGTDTNTVVFDTSGGAIAVSGAVAGGGAADTNNVSITGGSTVTSDAAWTTDIDGVSISGSGSKLTTGGALTATTITVGAGSELNAAGGNVIGAVNISGSGGTVTLGDDIDVTGAVDNSSGSSGNGALVITDAAGAGASVISGDVGATNALGSVTHSGAGTAQFDGTVAAASIVGSSTGTLDFNSNVTGAVSLSGDATVDLAATKTLTGSVNNTSGAAGSGTLILATTGGTTTVTGAIGSSNSLKQVTINGTGTAAFGSTVNAADIDFAGASTATFAGSVTSSNGIDLANNNVTATFADGANLTGNISSTGGANGTLNFSGDSTVTGQVGLAAGTAISALNVNGAGKTVTISGNSFVGTLATAATSTLGVGGNMTAAGAITNDGTITIAAGRTLTGASFGGTGSYNITVDDDGDNTLNAADFGQLASAGAINLAGETVHFVFNGNVANGTGVVIAAGGAAAASAASVTDSSLLLDAALAANGNNLEATITRTSIESVGVSASVQSVGAVLDTLASSTDPGIQEIQDALASASTVQQLEDRLEAAAPAVDGGAVMAGVAAVGTTRGITNTRLAALRGEGITQTGMVAGNVARGLQTWAQVFGSTGEQDRREGVDGYEVDSVGIAGGVDSEMIVEDWVFGAALSYANAEVSSQNANQSQTDVDTYQVSLYANHDINDRLYISGQAGYVFGDNAVTRTNIGGAQGLNASADYDSSAYTLSAETGRAYKNGRNLTLTPKLAANYVHYDADDYNETGAQGAGLAVETDALQVFEVGAGVDAEWLYQQVGGAFLKPRVNAGVRYDFIGNQIESTSRFLAGGTAFQINGAEPAQTTIDLGAGFTYYTTDNWELTADYDYETKEDFASHAGILRAGYRW